MTCEEMRGLVVRAQGRETNSPEEAVMSDHVTVCGGCAAFARDVRLLWAWTGEAAVAPPVPELRLSRRAVVRGWAAWFGLAAAAVVLVGILGMVVWSPAQDDPGVELTYRALFAEDFKGSKAEVTARAARVMELRLDRRGVKGHALAKDDTIVVRLPGASPENVAVAKALLARVGAFQLRPVGDQAVHEKFVAEGAIPEGFEKFPGEDAASYPWMRDARLVRRQAVVTNDDIAKASAEEDARSRSWKISFEMTEAGAAAFDVAAKELFNRSPKGHIAIVLDGQMISAPVVQVEKFGGQGQITGSFGEAEAKDLAASLCGAALPVPVKLEGEARCEK
jgi:preprotein translocase subunit SecD